MEGSTIEILGQKISYPTTWHGTTSVLIVCACIAFLGFTLDKDQIDSWSGVFNKKSEKAYTEALSTIEKKDIQIKELNEDIKKLIIKADLNDQEKQKLSQRLERSRAVAEQATRSLEIAQIEKEDEWDRVKAKVSSSQQQQQQQQLINNQQQIQQQKNNARQQQEQLQWVN